ncbi:hypothetical protein F2Q69_00053068 [Brassica cretica]|uniref:Uncharacterized protein n=1 Tax=Brassica cretica TaxID=69181 RepID=A0A8S9N0K9_BRACR|nr:hypothetical protein F2Q69_00053068 [Brassica cretica]
MEGSPYRKISFSRRKGLSLGPDPKCFLGGPRASPSGDPEAGVLPERQVWRLVRVLLKVLDASKDTRGDPDVYKGLRYLLISLNPTPALISRKMNPELLAFPSSLGDAPKADSEVIPIAPLRRRRSCFFDDGPRSEIREGDVADMRRKYAIHPSLGMRSEVSSFFGFCPSQLTPITWRMAIQVLGKLHGFSVGVHEILYSYHFAPLVNKARFYHLRSRDGTPLVEEPSRGAIQLSYILAYHRCISSGFLCWRSNSEAYNRSSPKIPMGDFSGSVVRLSVSAIYDEDQKAKTRTRRPFYTPLPRLARAASSVNGLSSTSSMGAEAIYNHDPLVDAHRRLIGEVLFLRTQVQDMMARQDLLVQQVRVSTRWELMKEWLEKRVEHWDPEEEYRRNLLLSGGIDQQSGSFSRVATPKSIVGIKPNVFDPARPSTELDWSSSGDGRAGRVFDPARPSAELVVSAPDQKVRTNELDCLLGSVIHFCRECVEKSFVQKLRKLAGFRKTLEYSPRDKFWDLVSGCLMLCQEMLETSVLGLGQDLGLITALGGSMTTSTYVSRIVFDLIPSRFKVRDMFSAYVTCMVGIKHPLEDNF